MIWMNYICYMYNKIIKCIYEKKNISTIINIVLYLCVLCKYNKMMNDNFFMLIINYTFKDLYIIQSDLILIINYRLF